MEQVHNPKPESPFYTAREAAGYLRLEERTLNAMRWRNDGPGWRKHGGRVVYHKEELDRWSRDRGSNLEKRPEKNKNKSDKPKSGE